MTMNEDEIRNNFKLVLPEDFMVFKSKYPLTSTIRNFILWKDNEPKKFIEIARSMQAKQIYLYSEKETAEPSRSTPVTEIGFLFSGVFHIMSLYEGGQKDEVSFKSTEVPGMSSGSHLLEMKPEDVATEMVQFVRGKLDYMSPDSFNIQYFFKKFWQSHGVDTNFLPGTEQKKLINQIEKLASDRLKK